MHIIKSMEDSRFMNKDLRSVYIVTFTWFTCMSFLVACSFGSIPTVVADFATVTQDSSLTVVTEVANQDSSLLKALNCDEFSGSENGWTWVTKSVFQEYISDYEWVRCLLGGNYQQRGLLVTYELKKSQTKITISPDNVKRPLESFPGVEITPPNFVKTGQAMFSYCIRDTRLTNCFIEVQYNPYVTLFVSMTIDNSIPFSSLEKLLNANLLKQDEMVKGELVP